MCLNKASNTKAGGGIDNKAEAGQESTEEKGKGKRWTITAKLIFG
jgi:hypothetical protein